MTRNRLNKTRLLLTAGALFVFSSPALSTVSFAQSGGETAQLMNRIHELENQIQTLSRAVYKGDMSGASAMQAGDAATAATNESRMSAIEDQQRKLTGQLEKITYDLQQVKDRLDHMQSDSDQRFQQLEHGPANANTTTAPVPEQPASSGSVAPAGTLGAMSSSGGTAEALYESAFADVRDGKYDDGQAKLKQFMSQYPGHALTPNAQYWLGETYYVRGEYKDAARTFAQGYQDYPKSGKAEDSLYKLALSLAKLGKKDDACLSLRQLLKDFASDTGPLKRKADDQVKQLACP